MRILVLSNLYPPDAVGGYELGCAQMTEALRARGGELRVVTSAGRGGRSDALVRRVLRYHDPFDPVLNAEVHPAVWRSALLSAATVDSHNLRMLREQVDDFAPDVVYLWHLLGIGGMTLALATHLRGLPWVWHLMDAVPVQVCTPAGSGSRRLAGLLGRRLTGGWMVCSRGLLGELDRGGFVPRGRVDVVPNWIAGPQPPPRLSWYRPGAPLRCAFTGRLVAEKGLHIAVEVMAGLRAEGRPIDLDIYGDGPERATLEARVRSLRLDQHVRFHGMVPQIEVTERLADHDMLVFPTATREPFAFSPIEAAAVGCVPLFTAGCGNAEWFVDGVHALTASRDADAFTAVLRDVMAGAIDLGAVGRRGQAIVREQFRIDAVVPRVESMLEWATERGGAGPLQPVAWDELELMARLAGRLGEAAISTMGATA